MTKRRFKKDLIPYIGALVVVVTVFTITLIGGTIKMSEDDDFRYVSDTILDEAVPVTKTDVVLFRPYNDSKVKVLSSYYDFKGDEESQKNSLTYHSDTYLQNTGVTYGMEEAFDVQAVLDGTVITVKEDELLGNIVEIKHDNNIISVYQSLTEVNVKVNDTIKQGTIIAKSGTSNLNPKLSNHLIFELIVNGKNINPETCYDKKLDEF